MKKLKNDGFSLVELLVVIAIVVIVASGIIAGASNLNYANFKKAAGKVNNDIADCRAICMSHEDPAYLYLYIKGGSVYTYTSTVGNLSYSNLASSSGKRIGNAAVQVKYRLEGASSDTTMADGTFIEISFKMNGAFRTGAPTGAPSGNNTRFFETIELVNRKSGRGRVITMTKLTGKHYMQ